jgi:orotidine-5'-phosphate decarboxylase
LAVDVADLEAARALVERVADRVGGLKIGKELFTSCGPAGVRELSNFGLPIFLDLKFHDIPSTVAGAVRAAAGHGVRWLSLHTSGGAAMLEAAVRARDAMPSAERPKLLGVTLLTSLAADPEEVVDRALLAQRCGLDGAIASPREVTLLRAACGPDFLLVTPGVRPAGCSVDDQSRVATPHAAIHDGADLLVVGRPIRTAADPASAASALAEEVAAAEASMPARAPSLPTGANVEARLHRMLRESQAFLEGHFILTSGLHSNRYVQCAKLLQHPAYARRAGAWLAEKLRPYEPHAVISVALGGLVIGQEVAAALGVRAVFAERDSHGGLALRRGFELERGERVAIVDDVCTRGTSIAECAALVEEYGAASAVTGAIIDRSGGNRGFDLPLEALVRIDAIAIHPDECAQCAQGIAAVKPGSRRL